MLKNHFNNNLKLLLIFTNIALLFFIIAFIFIISKIINHIRSYSILHYNTIYIQASFKTYIYGIILLIFSYLFSNIQVYCEYPFDTWSSVYYIDNPPPEIKNFVSITTNNNNNTTADNNNLLKNEYYDFYPEIVKDIITPIKEKYDPLRPYHSIRDSLHILFEEREYFYPRNAQEFDNHTSFSSFVMEACVRQYKETGEPIFLNILATIEIQSLLTIENLPYVKFVSQEQYDFTLNMIRDNLLIHNE